MAKKKAAANRRNHPASTKSSASTSWSSDSSATTASGAGALIDRAAIAERLGVPERELVAAVVHFPPLEPAEDGDEQPVERVSEPDGIAATTIDGVTYLVPFDDGPIERIAAPAPEAADVLEQLDEHRQTPAAAAQYAPRLGVPVGEIIAIDTHPDDSVEAIVTTSDGVAYAVPADRAQPVTRHVPAELDAEDVDEGQGDDEGAEGGQ